MFNNNRFQFKKKTIIGQQNKGDRKVNDRIENQNGDYTGRITVLYKYGEVIKVNRKKSKKRNRFKMVYLLSENYWCRTIFLTLSVVHCSSCFKNYFHQSRYNYFFNKIKCEHFLEAFIFKGWFFGCTSTQQMIIFSEFETCTHF